MRGEKREEREEKLHLHCIYPPFVILYICTCSSAEQLKIENSRNSNLSVSPGDVHLSESYTTCCILLSFSLC